MKRITIYLNGPHGPGSRDWHQAYLLRQDAFGLTVVERADGSGAITTYPATQIQRYVEHG